MPDLTPDLVISISFSPELKALAQAILTKINIMPLTSASLNAFFALVTQLITTDVSQASTIADLKAQLAASVASNADLADPALSTQLDALTTAAANALAPAAPAPAAPAAPATVV